MFMRVLRALHRMNVSYQIKRTGEDLTHLKIHRTLALDAGDTEQVDYLDWEIELLEETLEEDTRELARIAPSPQRT